jgi:SAM-dependent methyltransferase
MPSTLESGFHLADSKGYMLGRGHAAACRLNLQFYLWKESLQFNIHPSIPIPATPAIADIGTGTAIWLLDVAHSLPTATLDGYDIDLSNTPPTQWLPQTLTLHNWNLFDPVPDHLVGKYDIIHLRLLILVVQNSDPVPVIRNVSRLLKPGGYIQWDDLNYPDTHIAKADADQETPAFDRLRQFVYSNGRHDWVLNLPALMEQNGFEGARLDHFRDRVDLATANGEQHLATMEEFVLSLEKKGMVEDADNIRCLLRDVVVEAVQGVALSMQRAVVVARKV